LVNNMETNKTEVQKWDNLKQLNLLFSENKILELNREVRKIKTQLDNFLRDNREKLQELKNVNKEIEQTIEVESQQKPKMELIEDEEIKLVKSKTIDYQKVEKSNDIERNFDKSKSSFNNQHDRERSMGRPNFNNRQTDNRERDNKNNKFNKDFNRNNNQQKNGFNNKPFDKNKSFNQNPQNTNDNKAKTFKPNADSGLILDLVKENKYANNKKKDNNKNFDENRKTPKKKQLTLRGYVGDGDEERATTRKLKVKKEKQEVVVAAPVTKITLTSENITVKDLSEKTGKSVAEIVKRLFILGVMATINSTLDLATTEIVANDLGIEVEHKIEKTYEEKLDAYAAIGKDDEALLQKRPPIVTVMGHVDHGKTSLLDAIRATNVVAGEAGGITQHIGAYTIKKNDRLITFIDTPGHAAFTAMRARGASVTDIAILVVAADDGIKPQTIEAINHIKAAGVPMIVAINKIDKEEANIERVKQQLTEYDVIPEEWGGDAIMAPISAKTGEGIDKLLELMLLVADIQELKANPSRPAIGTIIEAKLDRGRGPVATVLVQNGTLKIGNTVISGSTSGKIRAMIDDTGKNVVSVGPSIAVAVLGFEDVPNAGDSVQVVDEKFSKQILQERKAKMQLDKIKNSGGASLDDFMNNTSDNIKNLNLIVKADVQGSVEALKSSLINLSNEEVKISVIHSGAGAVNETDVLLAQASNAMVIGFNIKTEGKIEQLAEKSGVSIKNYKVIYEALDDVTRAVKGLQAPKYKEVVIGHAEIRVIYKITGVGQVAGSYVKDGVIRRNAKARVLRKDKEIFQTEIESVKLFKDDVKEAKENYECGIKLKDTEFEVGDIIECFIEEVIEE